MYSSRFGSQPRNKIDLSLKSSLINSTSAFSWLPQKSSKYFLLVGWKFKKSKVPAMKKKTLFVQLWKEAIHKSTTATEGTLRWQIFEQKRKALKLFTWSILTTRLFQMFVNTGTFFSLFNCNGLRRRLFPTATFCIISCAWMIEQKHGVKTGPNCPSLLSPVPNLEKRRDTLETHSHQLNMVEKTTGLQKPF